MTDFFAFSPPPTQAFQFQPTLDGESYAAVVTWSLFGARWMLNLYRADGTLIFALPVIGSADEVLVQAASWANGYVVLTLPHGYARLTTVDVHVSGFVPEAYNGNVRALVTAPNTIIYPLAADPGEVSTLGKVDAPINLAAGYFDESMLIFRESSQQFEVDP